jgi:hypothetical protein
MRRNVVLRGEDRGDITRGSWPAVQEAMSCSRMQPDPPRTGYCRALDTSGRLPIRKLCGCSSVVERQLPKLDEHSTTTTTYESAPADSPAPPARDPASRCSTVREELPSELVRVVAVWNSLPEHVRRAILQLCTPAEEKRLPQVTERPRSTEPLLTRDGRTNGADVGFRDAVSPQETFETEENRCELSASETRTDDGNSWPLRARKP